MAPASPVREISAEVGSLNQSLPLWAPQKPFELRWVFRVLLLVLSAMFRFATTGHPAKAMAQSVAQLRGHRIQTPTQHLRTRAALLAARESSVHEPGNTNVLLEGGYILTVASRDKELLQCQISTN